MCSNGEQKTLLPMACHKLKPCWHTAVAGQGAHEHRQLHSDGILISHHPDYTHKPPNLPPQSWNFQGIKCSPAKPPLPSRISSTSIFYMAVNTVFVVGALPGLPGWWLSSNCREQPVPTVTPRPPETELHHHLQHFLIYRPSPQTSGSSPRWTSSIITQNTARGNCLGLKRWHATEQWQK